MSLLALTCLFSQCMSLRCALWKCKGSCSCSTFLHVVTQVDGPRHQSVYADTLRGPADAHTHPLLSPNTRLSDSLDISKGIGGVAACRYVRVVCSSVLGKVLLT